ncbi:putative membrane protein [Yersinia pestis 1045]|uniref:Uncharacterized protein n=6 Tax=Yersinia pseudotuberculosis complex TaxID=1649845 RepID=Q8CL94_YERPE|nr:hypothetical [Yersinia pestis KIM10+]ABG13842.1 conserved hypothetical protein [Yersinia pestis Antiqua]ABG18312.1 conserved hypothetical protein [Yersinia pestis Nepal516]ABP40185.1 conserved hypothetical protein [Yersinia pestis Pestoides F]ADV98363.1 hypothetical protein YPC_1751 [Yersinia pestis biovar Medievalis str. Harbin 35]AEL74145.1 hypothetical protein A1122_17640 [Yersinia pestis A1122]AIN15543.1 putative membrane protein [Yersinia pseudotuberculosis]AJI89830.1 putative membra
MSFTEWVILGVVLGCVIGALLKIFGKKKDR